MEILNQLDRDCQKMADAVKGWLPEITLDRYCSFLDRMYHYTLKSGERLKWVSERASDPTLQSVFLQLSKEEVFHYKLAESDLISFGLKPREHTPQLVIDFHKMWLSVQPQKSNFWCGSMYVLENVGQHLAPEARSSLQRLGLKPNQARFVLAHLEEDVTHGDRLSQLCRTYADCDPEAMLLGAHVSAEFWIALHREALMG